MIRTLLAVAAIAVAAPAIASAQNYQDDQDSSSVTVLRERPDTYSIIISTAGKSPQQVSSEVWDAAYTACDHAPMTGSGLDLSIDTHIACVNQARSNAMAQYYNVGYGQ